MAARADHFIRTLPDGYDTQINEEDQISHRDETARQARAFLANPPFLYLMKQHLVLTQGLRFLFRKHSPLQKGHKLCNST